MPKIVEEEAELVREIYNRFIGGDSLNAIAEDFNDRCIPTPSGRKGAIWKAESIKRILTNEKYRGDARLQKTYIEDFLTKKVKVNHGERRQWYVHDSHDAIIKPECFELAQKELARRTGKQGRFYDSPFSKKIICGDCGGNYGHRVWHSNESCRKEIWFCNHKYDNESVCLTPAITEDEVEQAFLFAINRIRDRKAYCDEFETEILPIIGDTDELQRKFLALKEDLNDSIAELERMVLENAQKRQDQTIYQQKFESLSASIEHKKAIAQSVEQQIADALTRKENAQIFLEGLRNIKDDGVITMFDIPTWQSIVEYAKVTNDGNIIFYFRNGNEETVKIKNAH